MKTKSKADAKRIQKVWDLKLDQRKLGLIQKKIKLVDVLDDFIERKKATLKPGTIQRYKEQIKNLLDNINVEFCDKLTTDDLIDYIKIRKSKGRANKTIKEELAILKAALLQKYRDGQLSEVPIREWPALNKVVVKAETVGYYTLAEVEALKKYFLEREFDRFFTFGLYTGCRRSEIVNARWRDVDLVSNAIRIRNIKTETSGKNQFRTISIHPELKRIFLQPGKANALLFPEAQKHSRNWPANQMKAACKKIGVPYRRFHGLRHTTATYLLAAKVPLREVMQLMGWTQLETAQRYIHLANAAAAQMSKLPY